MASVESLAFGSAATHTTEQYLEFAAAFVRGQIDEKIFRERSFEFMLAVRSWHKDFGVTAVNRWLDEFAGCYP